VLRVVATYVLWVAAPVIQAYVLGIMVRRNLRRQYPAFFAYTIFSLAEFLTTFPAYHISYAAYFYLYWVAAVLGVGFGFAMIREVFYTVFRPYDSLREMSHALFNWAVIVLLLVALVSVISGSASGYARIMQTIFVLQRSVCAMQVGLVLFLFLFAGMVGVRSRSYVFGIALGFGIFAAMDLLQATMRAAFGSFASGDLNLLKSLSFDVACLIWCVYLRAPEPARAPLTQIVEGMQLHFALQAAGQSAHVSALPLLEDVVARVLEKRNPDESAAD
jgi:hypothetical protein